MRYYYTPGAINSSIYASVYVCDHPVYRKCTLYKQGNKGLAVIQQRYNPKRKFTWWADIDPWLVDALYLNEKFKMVFEIYSKEPIEGLYPAMSVRQLMWKLRMKPLKREPWETVFDKCPI